MERARINGKGLVFMEEVSEDALGYAIWYTFSRLTIHKSLVQEWFAKHGLEKYAPEDPDHRDAFKRICSQYKEVLLRKDDKKETYLLIRPIDKGGNIRKLVIEERSGGKRVSYKIAGEIEYDKPNRNAIGRIKVTLRLKDEDVQRVVEEIVERWEKEKDCYTEEYLRRILLDIINDCSGKVRLKPSGGVYFIPLDEFRWIERFANVVEEIKKEFPDNKTEIWYAPISDTEYFRNLLKEKVEEALEEVINSAIQELVTLSEAEDISEAEKVRRIKEVTKKIELVSRSAKKYTKLLQTQLRMTENLLKDAEHLLERVKAQ